MSMFDKDGVVRFIGSLQGNTKTEKVFTSMRTNLEEIYKLEQKEFDNEKKEYSKEKKEARRKERDAKRKKADRKGLLGQIFSTNKEKKESSNDLMGMLLAGGLLAGGAALTWNYREEILEYINETLKPLIQENITNAITELGKKLIDWSKDQARKAGDAFTEAARTSDAGRSYNDFQESVQDRFAGYGITKGGTVFTLMDLTAYNDQLRETARKTGVEPPGEVRDAINAVQKRLKSDRSMNDQTFRKTQELEAVERVGGPGSPQRAERLRRELKELKVNREQNRRLMADEWAKLRYTDEDLQRIQRKQGRRDDKGYIFRQTGGTVTPKEQPQPTLNKPSGKEIDERMFSTTGYEDGLTTSVAKLYKTAKKQHYQTGGLVILQGHGDVPSNSGIAPGTDGPGTDYEGKYRPTAEQHFVHQVNKRTAQLAQKENVPISYQQSTGKYLSASHPKSNWSIANGIRRKGGSAIEMHFDAYGMQNGRMIEGARGILKGGQGGLTNIEKSVERKFGTHPSSSKGWGTLMLELDSLKYARQRLNDYPRMLVDAVKNAGAKGPAPSVEPGTTSSGTDSNPTVKPGGTNSGASPNTPTTGPAPNKPMTGGFGGFGNAILNAIPGVKAFASGFKSGFSKSMSAPPTPPKKYQTGGVVGMKPDKIKQRISEAHSNYLQGAGNRVARPVVVVKRAPAVIPPTANSGPSVSGGGGGLNMVEAANALHRIQSGAKF